MTTKRNKADMPAAAKIRIINVVFLIPQASMPVSVPSPKHNAAFAMIAKQTKARVFAMGPSPRALSKILEGARTKMKTPRGRAPRVYQWLDRAVTSAIVPLAKRAMCSTPKY